MFETEVINEMSLEAFQKKMHDAHYRKKGSTANEVRGIGRTTEARL
jgi:hypothetical protein